jgi:hypothetical protein
MALMGFEPRLVYVCTTPCHRLALGWCHEEHGGNIGDGSVVWFLDFDLFPFPPVKERRWRIDVEYQLYILFWISNGSQDDAGRFFQGGFHEAFLSIEPFVPALVIL